MTTQGKKKDPLTKEILKNKGSKKANILHQTKQMFLQRRWGLNISLCLRYQQGSERALGYTLHGSVVMSLPWEPFWALLIAKGFHEIIRAWEELCSVAGHALESPASLCSPALSKASALTSNARKGSSLLHKRFGLCSWEGAVKWTWT